MGNGEWGIVKSQKPGFLKKPGFLTYPLSAKYAYNSLFIITLQISFNTCLSGDKSESKMIKKRGET